MEIDSRFIHDFPFSFFGAGVPFVSNSSRRSIGPSMPRMTSDGVYPTVVYIDLTHTIITHVC